MKREQVPSNSKPIYGFFYYGAVRRGSDVAVGLVSLVYQGNDPNGIRTRVTAVKGRCPGPLDDRVKKPGNIGIAIVRRKANW